jgi:hypothetical protein
VGRVLLIAARAALVASGFREAVLWVLAGNERAQRFYRADGWLPDGARREEDVWGSWPTRSAGRASSPDRRRI